MNKLLFVVLTLFYTASSYASEKTAQATYDKLKYTNENSLLVATLHIMHDHSLELANLYSLFTINSNRDLIKRLLSTTEYGSNNIVIRGLMAGIIDGILSAIEVRCISTILRFFSGKILEHLRLDKQENTPKLTGKPNINLTILILQALYTMRTTMADEELKIILG